MTYLPISLAAGPIPAKAVADEDYADDAHHHRPDKRVARDMVHHERPTLLVSEDAAAKAVVCVGFGIHRMQKK